jgi:2-phospho-L-lactate guanylyltransferase
MNENAPRAVGVTALIPVKSLHLGKSRLGTALTPQQRVQLTEDTLRRLLHLLHTHPGIGGICVVTRDAHVARWLAGRNVRIIKEHGVGLNPALQEAREVLMRDGAQALLILPADLAAISSADIDGILALGEHNAVVIAPDRRGGGTNALLMRPPEIIPLCFGADSAHAHAAAARAAEAKVAFWHSDSIGLDLDEPEDITRYLEQW